MIKMTESRAYRFELEENATRAARDALLDRVLDALGDLPEKFDVYAGIDLDGDVSVEVFDAEGFEPIREALAKVVEVPA